MVLQTTRSRKSGLSVHFPNMMMSLIKASIACEFKEMNALS